MVIVQCGTPKSKAEIYCIDMRFETLAQMEHAYRSKRRRHIGTMPSSVHTHGSTN